MGKTIPVKPIAHIQVLLMTGDYDTAVISEEAALIKESNKNSANRFVMIKAAVHDLFGEKFRQAYVESIKFFLVSL